MRIRNRPTTIQLCAAALVIAVPVALIVSTWEPLALPPRPARTNLDERPSDAGTAVANSQDADGSDRSGDRKSKKDVVPTYAIPTSVTSPLTTPNP